MNAPTRLPNVAVSAAAEESLASMKREISRRAIHMLNHSIPRKKELKNLQARPFAVLQKIFVPKYPRRKQKATKHGTPA